MGGILESESMPTIKPTGIKRRVLGKMKKDGAAELAKIKAKRPPRPKPDQPALYEEDGKTVTADGVEYVDGVGPRWTTGVTASKANRNHGRKPHFNDAGELREMVERYFDWLEANPLYAAEFNKFQGAATLIQKPVRRVAHIFSLCSYIGVTHPTWLGWKRKDLPERYRSDLLADMEDAERRIYEDKFEGVTSGFYNASIIARDLGLVEKTEVISTTTVQIDEDDGGL
jgi:hypothetical protein